MKHFSARCAHARRIPCREVRRRPFALFAIRLLLLVSPTVFSAAPAGAESWLSMDVGKTVAGATVITANTTFTVTGSGDIGGTSDSFRFVFLRAKGDCEITARLVAQTAAGPAPFHAEAKAGVMIRQTLSSATLHAALLRTAGGHVHFQWRLSLLGITAARSDSNASLPCWLRVRRNGHTISAYFAGETAGRAGAWTKLGGDVVIEMSDPVYVGLCVSSHLADTPITAVFDHLATKGAVRLGAGLILGQLTPPDFPVLPQAALARLRPPALPVVCLQ